MTLSCRQLLVTSAIVGILTVWTGVLSVWATEKMLTGPETEKRFPALTVPDGFQSTLFACDPLVEYPSVISLGPAAGSLFVAYDYMTGLGIEIVRRDEIRLLRDTDGDGYADQSTLVADGFNSIQGLASHSDYLYVMHAPLLTRLEDTNDDGVAEKRRDLLLGLGLPPEKNDNRLHSANGVIVGHDGWLYLALGDRGCDVIRPEGDRLLFRQGGILRCRPDGTDLHIFSRGLRNIYDVALDQELNVFVRDNENDGGDYMIRLCHCFHGSDHGYPYLYHERPDEAMLPLTDQGRGSSAGAAAYLETAFPPAFRESLFFCEWGRAVVRYRLQRTASRFLDLQEMDFATGKADDPYGFKPTDLVVDRDGSLLISDWADGQRPKRGRGRIYRVTYLGGECSPKQNHSVSDKSAFCELLQQLNSESYFARVSAQEAIERLGAGGVEQIMQAMEKNDVDPLGRLHAVWIIAQAGGHHAIKRLFDLAATDPDVRVRVQAIRAIADLSDPVLAQHRLGAGGGDESVCRRLAKLAEQAEERVRFEVLIGLARLHWSDGPQWLGRNWKTADAAMSHAAMLLLRSAGNWSSVLRLLDDDDNGGDSKSDLRTLALCALSSCANEIVAAGLLTRLPNEAAGQRRREYLDLLARVYKRPVEQTYWGFRPAPRPANSVSWEYTEQIGAALAGALRDPESDIRVFSAGRMLREEIPIPLAPLAHWLRQESDAEAIAVILKALRNHPPADVRDMLVEIVCNQSYPQDHRLAALDDFVGGLDTESQQRLLEMGETLEQGQVLAALLQKLPSQPSTEALRLLIRYLDSSHDDVRAAAIESLLSCPEAALAPQVTAHLVTTLLRDSDLRVRRAATILAGELQVQESADLLLQYAGHVDLQLRSASLQSLRNLGDPQALQAAVAAMAFPECQPAALSYLELYGDRTFLDTVTKTAGNSRSIEVMAAAIRTLVAWQDNLEPQSADRKVLEQSISRIHSVSGIPLLWQIVGPVTSEGAATILKSTMTKQPADITLPSFTNWTRMMVDRSNAGVLLPAAEDKQIESVWLAATDVLTEEPDDIEFLASSHGSLTVWLNGREVFKRSELTEFRSNSERLDGRLAQGGNRLLVRVGASHGDAHFQLHFRRKSSQAEHERLTQKALTDTGDSERGRKLFMDADKSQCIHCHRIGAQGARIGPDLAGIGSRFSRIHLVESILEPSRTVAPSYETMAVVLNSGRILAGVKVSETGDLLALGDTEGKIHEINKSEIEEMQTQSQSTMPDGLEKRLTELEFVDLISFLVSEKKIPQQ